MVNRDLLKEAIADAKAVKETAIANAKAALEEAFTPYLKEKLAAKLAEMDEEEEMAEGMKVEKEAKKMKDVKEADDAEGYEGQMGKKDLGVDEAEEMDEMDLDELLAELDDELNENARTDAEEEGYKDGMKDEKEDEEDKDEDEEIDLEEMSEDDLKSFIEDVIADMVKAGELEAGDEFEAEGEEEIEVEDEEEVTIDENARTDAEEEGYLDGMHDEKEDLDEIDLNGDFPALAELLGVSIEAAKYLTIATGLAMPVILGMIQAGGSAVVDFFKKLATKKAVAEEVEDMDEMKKEIEELKKDLNEVNLLNSKLLYVNKIFRGKNLNENQKAKVLGAFDKATTVAEVKLVFETLSEGLTPSKAAIKENLGSASKVMASPAKKPILEVNNQFERWQKLAGIK